MIQSTWSTRFDKPPAHFHMFDSAICIHIYIHTTELVCTLKFWLPIINYLLLYFEAVVAVLRECVTKEPYASGPTITCTKNHVRINTDL